MPDIARQPRQPRQPRPFSGSYLETACRLDAAYPGFLNSVLRASDLRRAAIFAALAEIKLSGIDDLAARLRSIPSLACHADFGTYAQIARALMAARAREIVRAIYSDLPDGYLGLLARLGPDPLPDRGLYRVAFNLFNNPANKARGKLLRQLTGTLSATKIEVAARLDPVLLHPAAFERLYDVNRVETLHAALAIIRALVPEATDEALRRSLDGLSPADRGLSQWVQRWLRRMTRLPVTPPIPENDPELRLLSGPDMIELGRRFRNCAADRIAYLAVGSRLFFEWVGPGSPAVVELRALSGGRFVVEDLKGLRNAAPEQEVAAAIRARLEAAGVLSYCGFGQGEVSTGLMHLLGTWDHEHAEPEPFLANVLGRNAARRAAA